MTCQSRTIDRRGYTFFMAASTLRARDIFHQEPPLNFLEPLHLPLAVINRILHLFQHSIHKVTPAQDMKLMCKISDLPEG